MALIQKQGQPVYGAAQPQPGPQVNPQAQEALRIAQYHGTGGNSGATVGAAGQGAGDEYVRERRSQAPKVLQAGMTSPEEGDFALRNQLRGSLSQALSQYEPAAQTREDNFMANNERMLSRNLAQARRQMGGTGMGGSLQAGRGLGDLLAGSQREANQGFNQMQLQRGQELAQLAGVGGNVLQQSLAERGMTYEQSKGLADLLNRQADAESGAIQASYREMGPSDLEKGIGYALQMGAIGASALGGGGGGGGGMMAMMSDVHVKKNIEPGGAAIEAFLSTLTPYAYEYKNPQHGDGRYVSVMAQDLEKTPLGKELVFETAEGKAVDYGKAFGLMLAANAHLYREIQNLRKEIHEQTVSSRK